MKLKEKRPGLNPGQIILLTVYLLIFSIFALNFSAQAQFSDGADAVDLLGQYDQTSQTNPVPSYIKSGANDAPNKFGFNRPRGNAVDSVNHRLFISDQTNNRVLVFNLDNSNILQDREPDYVLGQANFASNTAATTQSGMSNPSGLVYDSAGNRLFVADSTNQRVLVFDVSTIVNGMNAVAVLGQALFTTATFSTSQASTRNPNGLAFDPTRNYLFVAQSTTAHRVTVFDVAAITNGENAIHYLGQVSYVGTTSATSATRMTSPIALAYDDTDKRLFVAQTSNNRVTVYDLATITDGEAAVNVLGQTNFTNTSAATSQSRLSSPTGLAFNDADNLLFVSESGNNRVSVFDVTSITDGENAVNVLGQADYTSSGAVETQAGTYSPAELSYDSTSDRLYVGFWAFGSNRVTIFDVATVTDNENAVDILGQYDPASLPGAVPLYSGSNADNAPGKYGISAPYDVVVDTTNHRLFVSDEGNNRVLVYNLNSENLLIDRIADFVLGQTNFSGNSPGTTSSRLNSPKGMTLDMDSNHLYVADALNRRVLVFDTNVVTSGEPAINVLGQADFTSSSSATTQNGMNSPQGLAFDPVGKRLFVSEGSNRITVFDVNSITDGENAINVLGQPDYTTNVSNSTAQALNSPADMDYDHARKLLFVADSSNSRVQIFDVTIINNGESAVNTLGHATFTSGLNLTQSGMGNPVAVSYDSLNERLFVSDQTYHRVTIFDVSTITNGENAESVIGADDFVSNTGRTTQDGFNGPRGLLYDDTTKRLYVAEVTNNRIMIFAEPPKVEFSASTFVEAGADDGSIATTITATLDTDNFTVTNGVMTVNTHYTVANVPAGLTAVVTGTNAKEVTIAFTGNAASHTNSEDISNFTVSFLDAAFSSNPASGITGSSKSDFIIDFSFVPTPTPTATATATSTPTMTNTATATVTSTSTATMTPTATATLTVTNTATATFTSPTTMTPTATATSTPTVTPTVATSEVRGRILDENGNPVRSIVVYLFKQSGIQDGPDGVQIKASEEDGTLSTITNALGEYAFTQVKTGTYKLVPDYTGFTFVPAEVSVSNGIFAQSIEARSIDLNDSGCNRTEFAEDIINSDEKARALLDFALAQVEKFKKEKDESLNRSLNKASRELRSRYTVLLNQSRLLPKVGLKCTGRTDCETVRFRKPNLKYSQSITSLRRLTFFVLRKSREALNQDSMAGLRLTNKVRSLSRRAERAQKLLPKKSDSCI